MYMENVYKIWNLYTRFKQDVYKIWKCIQDLKELKVVLDN